MKIKNIQQYRSFYKTTRPVSHELEENFIGNYYLDPQTDLKKFGWFTMYHGDRDGFSDPETGIENFLQSFLDMAKDGQAVYEFLQNAVDAGSSHYTMIWGEDPIDGNHYLLVANNGEMFSPNSIRSILNVGSSTKNADSQTIGKFGIGFKLAHRLVGKDNGLQELINENSGPVLFSWKNYDLKHLASGSSPSPTDIIMSANKKKEIVIDDENPWLFKILITCFPCLPENDFITEKPKMADGLQVASSPFSRKEYEVLSRWVSANQNILNEEIYGNGSLFFLKLGSGKESELAEVNLKEGVKFALAILKETADSEEKSKKILHTVQLNNDEPITYPDLEYIKLAVDRLSEQDTYAYIRFGADHIDELSFEQKKKINDEADIEILFGFRKHHEIGNYFQGAPNLYLYFPLSEEVHNFNYILHCNAFYKGSSRTFLHKGSGKEDGINERLLKVMVDKIDKKLKALAESDLPQDRELFLHFYAALLTSNKSTNQDRFWIEEPYINPLNELLKKYIPIRDTSTGHGFTVTDKAENVYIKKTTVEINNTVWGMHDVHWFYWNDSEKNIIDYAHEKLDIQDFNIHNLLSYSESMAIYLDQWIDKDENKIKGILSEISHLGVEIIKESVFKENLFKIDLLKFNNNELLSINTFMDKEKEGYFIIYNKLADIRDLLEKLDLIITVENFDHYSFQDKYFGLFSGFSQVRSYITLTKLFSEVVNSEKLQTFNTGEKQRIFEAFRTLNTSPGERLGELKLLNNNLNNPVRFKNLYSSSSTNWLSKFCINTNEDSSYCKGYLLDKPNEIYQNIVYEFWDQLIEYIAINKSQAEHILDDILAKYDESSSLEKNKLQLSTWKLTIYKSEVIVYDNIYFNKELITLEDEQFQRLQNVAYNYFNVQIPDKFLIPYLYKEPFQIANSSLDSKIEASGSLTQITDLLELCTVCSLDFFASHIVSVENNIYYITALSLKKQIATSKQSILNYLKKYYPNQYEPIPVSLNAFRNSIILTDNDLVQHLIECFNEGDINQELDLIEVILSESSDYKKLLINKITFTILEGTWKHERQNYLYLKLLNEILESGINPQELASIHKKIQITKDEQEINIGDVDSAHDSIVVLKGNKEIILSQSQILNLENADNIKLIQEFNDEAKKRELINKTNADKLFKISNTGITDELISKFNSILDQGRLTNIHQLLFVWLSGKFDKDKFKEYSLLSHDDKWYQLEKQLIIYNEENADHISSSFLTNSRYEALQSLVQISDLEIYNYGENEADIIAGRFIFTKGCNASILDGSGAINDKLEYLYRGWKNLPSVNKEYKRSEEWYKYLTIYPKQYILNGIHTSEEVLPADFLSWYDNEKPKDDFFKGLGVYVNNSPIDKIRSFLIGHTQDEPADIELRKFNEIVLLNTIKGLTGAFTILDKEPVIFNEENDKARLYLAEDIINHLVDPESPEHPVLIYNSPCSFKIIIHKDQPLYTINDELHHKLKLSDHNNLQQLYAAYNVIKSPFSINEKMAQYCTDLAFTRNFIKSEYVLEHDEPFYHDWKIEKGIRLFKEEELNFDYCIEIQNISMSIGSASQGRFYVDTSDGLKIFYNKQISLEELKNALADNHADLSEAIQNLVERKNIMLTSFYNALNAAGKSEIKSAHLEALEAAFKEENLKQKRKALIDNIKENLSYSYIWFECYLKFLLTFESKQDTINQKSITFQQIKRYTINREISNRYFLLCGASSLVPMNIEDFDDFKVTLIIKNKQNEDIKVEGVSKRGQDLLVFCREAIPQSTISKFNDVIQIKISFSPVIDLLERLYRAFTNRGNLSEWDEIKETLPNLKFIYGPPGTGKTTTLCSMIIDGVSKKNDAKYLLLTPTNKAADVLCKKLLNSSDSASDIIHQKLKQYDATGQSITVTRIGKPTDPELEELDRTIYQNSPNLQQLQYTNVVASTIHRIPYFDVIDDDNSGSIKLFKLDQHWDYVVFDEASMINLPYLVFAILAIQKFSPDAQFIIAGDPKQIPPVVDVNDKDLEELDIKEENVYTMMGINSFNSLEQKEVLRDSDTIENLSTQYRSVKKIGQLFSDLSYNDLLKHAREEQNNNAKTLPEAFRKIVPNNVSFIDIPLSADDSIYKINKLFYSPYHTYSAIFIAEIVKYFDTLLKDGESWTIGLIAPYKAQAVLLNKLITSFGISNKLKIYSDTVHGFQGDECDIVFFVSNPNNYGYSGHPRCLLSKEYIYNVAISRARDYLIVLHPFKAIKKNTFINSILESYTRNFGEPSIMKSSEIEKLLFQQSDYIKENSYITGHDNINVFGQIEMKYFIKANDNAIDIQLRKM